MITPAEAEKRAHDLIEQFVNEAGCRDEKDVCNVLMKLASMAGLAMAAVGGKEDAIARLYGCLANVAHAEVSTAPTASFEVAGTSRPH